MKDFLENPSENKKVELLEYLQNIEPEEL